ncbi:hypothetical protein AOLI_G00203900 [Acnodon oligacanthus]
MLFISRLHSHSRSRKGAEQKIANTAVISSAVAGLAPSPPLCHQYVTNHYQGKLQQKLPPPPPPPPHASVYALLSAGSRQKRLHRPQTSGAGASTFESDSTESFLIAPVHPQRLLPAL